MKYRVRVDLSFASETDAQVLMTYAKSLSGKAVSINEDGVNEELSSDLVWEFKRGVSPSL